MDPICIEKGALEIKEQIIEELKLQRILDEVEILDIPRIGDPETEGPDILVYPEGSHYIALTPESVRPLVVEHFIKGRELQQYSARMRDLMDEEVREPKDKEVRVILENIGKIDPRNIVDYFAVEGYAALAKVLTEMTPDDVIQTVIDSKLRGRGGAGFPAGLKWKFANQAPGSPK